MATVKLPAATTILLRLWWVFQLRVALLLSLELSFVLDVRVGPDELPAEW